MGSSSFGSRLIFPARAPTLSEVMSLFRPVRRSMVTALVGAPARRGLAMTPARTQPSSLLPAAAATQVDSLGALQTQKPSVLGRVAMAGSPLFLTDLDVPMYWGEIQFVLSGPINGLFESFFETAGGPLFLNGLVAVTLMRMGVYYGFFQPAYLWHFQERYGQTWTVGHHLYGSDMPNPLKKGGK